MGGGAGRSRGNAESQMLHLSRSRRFKCARYADEEIEREREGMEGAERNECKSRFTPRSTGPTYEDPQDPIPARCEGEKIDATTHRGEPWNESLCRRRRHDKMWTSERREELYRTRRISGTNDEVTGRRLVRRGRRRGPRRERASPLMLAGRQSHPCPDSSRRPPHAIRTDSTRLRPPAYRDRHRPPR